TPVLARVHPDFRATKEDRIRRLMAGAPAVPAISERWLRMNGDPLDVSVAATGLMFAGRRAVQTLFRDDSARVKAEADLVAARNQLEDRVAARTADLERANKELQAFTYSVSHDLRAPLRHIDGFARLLEEQHVAALTDEGRRHLATVRASAQRMGLLI